jgi:tetratricopeptide (TPR) repeat protein
MGRKIAYLPLGVLLVGFLFLASCGPKISKGLAEDLRELEMEDVLGNNTGQERIGEIEGFIRKEQNMALKVINSSDNTSRFYRMLGLQYMQLEMYGEAYKAFVEARLISPTNAILAYYQALAAANLAKNMVQGTSEKAQYMEIAKNSYQMALNLRSDFRQALYGSAIFYAYELGDLTSALGFVNRLIALSPRDERAWILKGNIHSVLGEREAALFAYQEAQKQVSSTADKEEIGRLMNNITR